MNIENLASYLKPWMQVGTWSSGHPLDSERFHKALKTAIEAHDSTLSYEDIKEAMELLADQLYSDEYDPSYLKDKIESFSGKADVIASYFYDTSKT